MHELFDTGHKQTILYHIYFSKHQTHYELWGELHGKVKVDGFDEKFVTLKSIRDHSFGKSN